MAKRRNDPLVPILGSLVSIAVVASLAFLVPGVTRWFRSSAPAVEGKLLSPTKPVEVWLGRDDDGIALVLEPLADAAAARRLDRAMRDGPYHYLSLTVFNFTRDEPYELDLARGLASPDGGVRLFAAAGRRRENAPAHLNAVLDGLGGQDARVVVRKGERGQVLLVMKEPPARRTAFVSGGLRLERREVARRTLAVWRRRPDWERFEDL